MPAGIGNSRRLAAVITPNVPGADKGAVIEDGQLTAGGKLDVVDPDAGQAVFVAQNNAATTYTSGFPNKS